MPIAEVYHWIQSGFWSDYLLDAACAWNFGYATRTQLLFPHACSILLVGGRSLDHAHSLSVQVCRFADTLLSQGIDRGWRRGEEYGDHFDLARRIRAPSLQRRFPGCQGEVDSSGVYHVHRIA